jgi:hypothetical protein
LFVRFEENPNCGFAEDRVWKELDAPRVVTHVLRAREGKDVWCPITGLNEKGEFISAQGRKVEDSGEGVCWLVYGGLWGLRLRWPDKESPWSLNDPTQWAEPFMLLPANGADVRFA